MRTAVAALVLVAACDPTPPPTVTYLTPAEHLARASLALRGTRPSTRELLAVTSHPEQLPHFIDAYLASPEFGVTIRELHDELLLLHPQLDALTPQPIGPLADISFSEMNGSIYDEPLRLIEDIVMTDQPYTRIVTADYTMADRIVATVWGFEHPGDDTWQRTAYPDGRDPAGILVSTPIHFRYRSVKFNHNRARANAFSRALLCHDFSASEIHIDTSVDLSNPEIIADAVVRNPSCAGCHQAMDPLASYFFAFRQGVLNQGTFVSYPTNLYHPEYTDLWMTTTARPPGYFGQAPEGLAGLGQAIAADPRFARCAAINFASYLTQTPAAELSPAWIAELQDRFVRSRYSAKQLAKAIVLSEPFHTATGADPVEAESAVRYRKLRPQQLQRMLADLTGFVWQDERSDGIGAEGIGAWRYGHVEYLEDDFFGFRVLAGGTDSWYVTEPTHTMSPTSSLVARRVAALAAAYVVDHDAAADAPDRRLFTGASVDDTDPDRVRAQLAELHARIYSELVAPDDPALDDTQALFDGALAASGDPRRAWTITLTGMLSDLRALYY